MSKIENTLKSEVETMHDVLAAWFRGDVPADRTYFETELVHRFAEECEIIYPSGSLLARKEFLDPVFNAHACNPSFGVAIRDFKLVALSNDRELATARYIEDQFNATNTVPANNSRFSTVVFRLTPNGDQARWLHVHETAIPSSVAALRGASA